MKIKYLLLSAVLFTVMRCNFQQYTYLKGQYPENIIWKETDMTFDRAFDKTVEYMTEKGIEIEDIDRPNGIIKLSLDIPTSMITVEKKGVPVEDNLAVVMSPTNQIMMGLTGRIVILIRAKGDKSTIGARLIVKNRDSVTAAPLRVGVATLGNYERYVLALIAQP